MLYIFHIKAMLAYMYYELQTKCKWHNESKLYAVTDKAACG